MELNPTTYNLPSRIELREIMPNHIAIVKLIKSRIIQKDAAKIVEMVKQIKRVDTSLEVSLICSSNICSKSLKLLHDNLVGVVIQD